MREKRRAGQGRPRAHSPPSPNRTRKGGGAPLSSFPSPLSFSTKARGGSPTPGGSRTPPGAPLGGRPHLPPPSFIYGGRGAPLDTQVDHRDRSLAVCGAPSTIFHLGHIVAVLRRSPASVEHHHRHHAVVLTKLSLNTRLDRSSRDVIELNVCRTWRCRTFGT